jgi:hypothetical protein
MQENQWDSSIVVAQIALMQTALLSLFATHPDKQALRARFAAQSNAVLENMLHTGVSDLAIDSARASQKTFLSLLE